MDQQKPAPAKTPEQRNALASLLRSKAQAVGDFFLGSGTVQDATAAGQRKRIEDAERRSQ